MFFLIYLLQRKLLSLRLELKHVTLTCQDHDTKSKRKTSLPSKIEGVYSHYAATLSFVPEIFERRRHIEFDTIMVEKQETSKCGTDCLQG